MRAALAALALCACGDDPASWFAEEPPRAPIPALELEGAVFYAAVTKAPVPPPALWAELPGDPASLGLRSQAVLDGICHGVPGAREAALPLLVAGSAWPGWIAGCDDAGFCDWALGQAEAPGAARAGLLRAASSCRGDRAAAALTDPDAPFAATLAWMYGQLSAGRPVDPDRLQAATEQAVAAADRSVADGIWALTYLPDAEARLLALGPRAAETWVAWELGFALRMAKTQEGRALWTAACQQHPDDGSCQPVDAVVLDPLRDLDAAVRRPDVDPASLVRAYPNHAGALRAALDRCVRDALSGALGAWEGRRCLAALAASDWTAAAALARENGGMVDLGWGATSAALIRFDGPEAVRADLVARGLMAAEDPAPGAFAVTAADHLVAAGRAVPLQSWGDDAQGWLARSVAARAGMGDVVLLVEPPIVTEATLGHREPRLTQLAWLDGVRYRSLAHDWGSPDAEQAVGFVNALLAARGDAVRVAVADGESQGSVAVVGAPDVLAALVDEGLIVPWLPEAPLAGVVGDTDGGYGAPVEPAVEVELPIEAPVEEVP